MARADDLPQDDQVPDMPLPPVEAYAEDGHVATEERHFDAGHPSLDMSGAPPHDEPEMGASAAGAPSLAEIASHEASTNSGVEFSEDKAIAAARAFFGSEMPEIPASAAEAVAPIAEAAAPLTFEGVPQLPPDMTDPEAMAKWLEAYYAEHPELALPSVDRAYAERLFAAAPGTMAVDGQARVDQVDLMLAGIKFMLERRLAPEHVAGILDPKAVPVLSPAEQAEMQQSQWDVPSAAAAAAPVAGAMSLDGERDVVEDAIAGAAAAGHGSPALSPDVAAPTHDNPTGAMGFNGSPRGKGGQPGPKVPGGPSAPAGAGPGDGKASYVNSNHHPVLDAIGTAGHAAGAALPMLFNTAVAGWRSAMIRKERTDLKEVVGRFEAAIAGLKESKTPAEGQIRLSELEKLAPRLQRSFSRVNEALHVAPESDKDGIRNDLSDSTRRAREAIDSVYNGTSPETAKALAALMSRIGELLNKLATMLSGMSVRKGEEATLQSPISNAAPSRAAPPPAPRVAQPTVGEVMR